MDGMNVNVHNVQNVKNADVSKTKQSSPNKEFAPFDTVEYVNKKNGITYLAKKLTLQQGDKAVNGVFVFAKDAKPDKNGQIQGEFMSIDKFLQKMQNELPTVNSQAVQSYNSNIRTSTPEEKFDRAYKNAVELSNGTKLIRPNVLNSGTTEIIKRNDGQYDVKFTSYLPAFSGKTSVETITEKELRNDNSLYAGTMKDLKDGNYEVLHENFGNEPIIMSKDETIKFLRRNKLYL